MTQLWHTSSGRARTTGHRRAALVGATAALLLATALPAAAQSPGGQRGPGTDPVQYRPGIGAAGGDPRPLVLLPGRG